MTFSPQTIRSTGPSGPTPGRTSAPASSSTPAASATPPHLHIRRLVLDGFGAHSAAALREGFRDAWEQAKGCDWQSLPDAVSRQELQVAIPPGLPSREIGARLAQALIQLARPTRAGSHAPPPHRA